MLKTINFRITKTGYIDYIEKINVMQFDSGVGVFGIQLLNSSMYGMDIREKTIKATVGDRLTGASIDCEVIKTVDTDGFISVSLNTTVTAKAGDKTLTITLLDNSDATIIDSFSPVEFFVIENKAMESEIINASPDYEIEDGFGTELLRRIMNNEADIITIFKKITILNDYDIISYLKTAIEEALQTKEDLDTDIEMIKAIQESISNDIMSGEILLTELSNRSLLVEQLMRTLESFVTSSEQDIKNQIESGKDEIDTLLDQSITDFKNYSEETVSDLNLFYLQGTIIPPDTVDGETLGKLSSDIDGVNNGVLKLNETPKTTRSNGEVNGTGFFIDGTWTFDPGTENEIDFVHQSVLVYINGNWEIFAMNGSQLGVTSVNNHTGDVKLQAHDFDDIYSIEDIKNYFYDPNDPVIDNNLKVTGDLESISLKTGTIISTGAIVSGTDILSEKLDKGFGLSSSHPTAKDISDDVISHGLKIGDLNNLTTAARDNLVDAINEAALTGGSGDGGTVPGNDLELGEASTNAWFGDRGLATENLANTNQQTLDVHTTQMDGNTTRSLTNETELENVNTSIDLINSVLHEQEDMSITELNDVPEYSEDTIEVGAALTKALDGLAWTKILTETELEALVSDLTDLIDANVFNISQITSGTNPIGDAKLLEGIPLEDFIFSDNNSGSTLVSDLDSITKSGFYNSQSGATNSPSLDNDFSIIHISSHEDDGSYHSAQLSIADNGMIYVRRINENETTPWVNTQEKVVLVVSDELTTGSIVPLHSLNSDHSDNSDLLEGNPSNYFVNVNRKIIAGLGFKVNGVKETNLNDDITLDFDLTNIPLISSPSVTSTLVGFDEDHNLFQSTFETIKSDLLSKYTIELFDNGTNNGGTTSDPDYQTLASDSDLTQNTRERAYVVINTNPVVNTITGEPITYVTGDSIRMIGAKLVHDSAGVKTVFGRTNQDIIAEAGDYNTDLITNNSSVVDITTTPNSQFSTLTEVVEYLDSQTQISQGGIKGNQVHISELDGKISTNSTKIIDLENTPVLFEKPNDSSIITIGANYTTVNSGIGIHPIEPLNLGYSLNGDSIHIGKHSGNSGEYCITLGFNAGAHNDENENTFIGHESGASSTCSYSTSAGSYSACYSNSNYTINFGTKAGYEAGRDFTSEYNIFLGNEAGSNSNGSNNIYLGHDAGKGIDGDDNILIGHSANAETKLKNIIMIGSSSDPSKAIIPVESNTVHFGNSDTLDGYIGTRKILLETSTPDNVLVDSKDVKFDDSAADIGATNVQEVLDSVIGFEKSLNTLITEDRAAIAQNVTNITSNEQSINNKVELKEVSAGMNFAGISVMTQADFDLKGESITNTDNVLYFIFD